MQIESLQSEEAPLHYQVKRLGGKQYLLACGIDKQFYDSLYGLLTKSFPLLLGVKMLAVHLAEKSLSQISTDKPVMQIFNLGRTCISLVCDRKGHVICSDHGDGHDPKGTTGIVGWAEGALRTSEESVEVIRYTTGSSSGRQSDGSTINVASVLGSRLNEPAVWTAAAGLAPVSSSAKAGSMALNSLRLLLHVLGSSLVLALAVFITTSIISSGNSEITDEYQSLYSEQIQLDRSIDSMQAAIADLHDEAGPVLPAADIVAAFCQIRYNDAFLTKLDISPGETMPVIEACGMARTERAVFRYSRKLDEFLSPFEVRMNSVSPQIDRSQRPPDTIVTFRMSLVMANDNE
jgi:hypothetical protein